MTKSLRETDNSSDTPMGGVARIIDGQLVWQDTDGPEPPVLLVPTEDVTLLAVSLPLNSDRQRRQALPFAVEEHLAESVESVHLALGNAVAEKTYLAAIVAHDRMQVWTETAKESGLERYTLLPDALTLPVPEGSGWTIAMDGDRALVRTPDGAGFATPSAILEPAWRSAGRPPIVLMTGSLPDSMAATSVDAVAVEEQPNTQPLDLRQGAYSPPRRTMPAVAKPFAVIAAALVLSLGVLTVIDTIALGNIAEKKRAELGERLKEANNGRPLAGDPALAAARMLPSGNEARSHFLSLLSATSAALQSHSQQIAMQEIVYNEEDGTMTVTIETADLAGLQQIEASLAAAGLSPVSGAANSIDGGASTTITVSRTGGRDAV